MVKWILKQEMALKKVHAVIQTALKLGPQEAQDPRILDISVVVKDIVWNLCKTLWEITIKNLVVLERSQALCFEKGTTCQVTGS